MVWLHEHRALELLPQINLNVFPNPVEGELQLVYDLPSANIVIVEIVDVVGRTVHFQNFLDEQPGIQSRMIDTGHLFAGMYTLKFRIGDKTLTRKFVKID